MENRHESVLLTEAIQALALREGDTVVDGTIGGAGHFGALLTALNGTGTLVGIDADPEAVARGKEAAKAAGGTRVEVVEGNFRDLSSILDTLDIKTVSKALFDLGWSSYHLSSGRGFSFRAEEPLLMTYGTPEAGKTAADIVNTFPEDELSEIFFSLGEERFARQIARGIAKERSQRRILTTGDLVRVIEASTPSWYHHRRIHPATKVFQALRMAVNDELGALRDALASTLSRLAPGGRVAFITFHSIEDRIVKSALRDAAHEGKGTLVSKKPILPSDAEVRVNPRARSAKLRVFERAMAPSVSTTAYVLA